MISRKQGRSLWHDPVLAHVHKFKVSVSVAQEHDPASKKRKGETKQGSARHWQLYDMNNAAWIQHEENLRIKKNLNTNQLRILLCHYRGTKYGVEIVYSDENYSIVLEMSGFFSIQWFSSVLDSGYIPKLWILANQEFHLASCITNNNYSLYHTYHKQLFSVQYLNTTSCIHHLRCKIFLSFK